MAHRFVVFKTQTCPYCTQAVGFLSHLQGQRPDVQVKTVDANANPAEFRKVAQRVGRNTVPQIFLDGQYVGGWDDLARAAKSGALDAYLDGGEFQMQGKKGFLARLREKRANKQT